MSDTRPLNPSIGQAVAERTYLRQVMISPAGINPQYLHPDDPHQQLWFQIYSNSGFEVLYDRSASFRPAPVLGQDYRFEDWSELSERVVAGNVAMVPGTRGRDALRSLKQAVMVPGGRHLQHGDLTQPTRPQTVFTNCATAASAWSRYYLLLNGSGVGRSVDDALLLVDWDKAPGVQCVIDEKHPDFQWGGMFLSKQEAEHRFGHGSRIRWHVVDDSREGWAKALELWEMMAWEGRWRDSLLILDFSKVRPRGAPIRGMQGRPSSGPIPTMAAFHKAAAGIGGGLPRWLATIYVEHYFSESVLVGGARRASGIITKNWRDAGILEFVAIKMPAIYRGLDPEEIIAYRKENGKPASTPLWTSNHSVAVDSEFWWLNGLRRGDDGYKSNIARKARNVFKAVTETAYSTGTGEPGFVNVDKLNVKRPTAEELFQ